MVIVRKGRVFEKDAEPLLPQAHEAFDAVQGSADNAGPRVFRVDAPAAVSGPHEAQPAAAAAPRMDALGLDSVQAEPRGPRVRRHASDKRPGPVTQIYRAEPGPDAGSTPGLGAAGGPQLSGQALAEMLSGVDAIFEAIRLAQSFRFLDRR